MEELTHEDQLKIISKAWGKQDGYCFFPWIRGDADDKRDRIQGYHEGPAFKWPQDRYAILQHMAAHEDDDLYWCPNLFEKKMRRGDLAMDEHALWADLDSKDPAEIEDYPPTVAWESSPGRYQALWLITAGDLQGASWPGNENQKLTYHIGADPSGWDSTQLLRIPGWRNHKPEYREKYGEPPQGKLLWKNGRRYLADDFTDLPDVQTLGGAELVDTLGEELDRVDRHEVWGRVRLKVSKAVRELVGARSVTGDRSERLWQIERDLADAGCSPLEIVAIVRSTVWNKFAGRQDEVKRLLTEAIKAVGARPEATEKALEEERGEYPELVLLGQAIKNYPTPKWLVEGVLAEGAVGFFAGEPKSFKTWFGLDLALSVATGTDFLGYFRVLNPGPVLYIQAEDGPSTIRQRYDKVLPNKMRDKVTMTNDEQDAQGFDDPHVYWEPANTGAGEPPILTPDFEFDELPVISDPGWQSWLDEVLSRGLVLGGDGEDFEPYRLMILDPMMMLAGDVEENRAQAMTAAIFKPLKTLARKHGVAIIVVHHMRKSSEKVQGAQRGGQRMLGSVANHAWSEDSVYVTHGRYGALAMEVESKHSPGGRYEVKNIKGKRGRGVWEPRVEALDEEGDDAPVKRKERKKSPGSTAKKASTSSSRGRPRDTNPPALRALKLLMEQSPRSYSTHEVKDKLAEMQGKQATQTIYLQAYQQLKKCWEHGQVQRVGKQWKLAGAEYDPAEELSI